MSASIRDMSVAAEVPVLHIIPYARVPLYSTPHTEISRNSDPRPAFISGLPQLTLQDIPRGAHRSLFRSARSAAGPSYLRTHFRVRMIFVK